MPTARSGYLRPRFVRLKHETGYVIARAELDTFGPGLLAALYELNRPAGSCGPDGQHRPAVDPDRPTSCACGLVSRHPAPPKEPGQ